MGGRRRGGRNGGEGGNEREGTGAGRGLGRLPCLCSLCRTVEVGAEEEAAAQMEPCPVFQIMAEDMHCRSDKVAAVQHIVQDTVVVGDTMADRAAAQDRQAVALDRAAAVLDRAAAALDRAAAALDREVAVVDTEAAVQDIAADIGQGMQGTEGVVLRE